MSARSLIDRYRGTLLGLAAGDALGGPVEFLSRDDIASQHPTGLRDFVGGGWLRLAPGEITDDTQMTLAIAESLALGGALDMNDIASRFLDWYRSAPKDIGNTTRAALAHLHDGRSWEEAGRLAAESGVAAGNGSVMRCAPVALRYRLQPEMLVQASIDTARVTHADPRCVAGAVAINAALVTLLRGGDAEAALKAARESVDEPEISAILAAIPTLHRDDVRAGGFVGHTVGAAMWCLVTNDSAEETIVAAVMLGEDTDTTGAVAGALAGARYGASALPQRWRNAVQHADRLNAIAERLLELSMRDADSFGQGES